MRFSIIVISNCCQSRSPGCKILASPARHYKARMDMMNSAIGPSEPQAAEAGSQMRIADLGDSSWLADSRYAGMRVEIFTSEHGVIPLESTKYALSLVKAATRHPVRVSLVEITQEMTYNRTVRYFTRDKGGAASLHIEGLPDKLLPGFYTVLASPFIRTEEGGYELSRCVEALEAARGCLLTMLGDTFAEDDGLALEISSDNPDQANHSASFVARVGALDYRFVSDQGMADLATYLSGEHDPLWIGRFKTAFLFMGRARSSNDPRLRFFDMWTALEAFTGGYSKLAGRIDKSQKVAPLWFGMMRGLKEKRRILVHQGARPAISTQEESLIAASLVFWMLEQADAERTALGRSLFI